jgi:superfamily II DNA or RNA helicase
MSGAAPSLSETDRQSSSTTPEVGQAVRVRNRLATVRAVEPYDGRDAQGRLHLVDVEYLDDCRFPEAEQLLWEVEATATVLGKTSLPSVDADRPDSPTALMAFVNAHRWSRLNRLRASEGIEDEPLLGVWNSAIQVHPYQLEPVLKALAMPRVSLLLADGVGLGKTIQSGLVLEELLLRRRIRRILVLCPAMLQRQWQYELRRKFNLEFKVIDSDSTFKLRRDLGIDTNPWKAFPRVITSMDYLRMPDVLQQFLQASGAGPDAESNGGRTSPHAPWDLLIVDECHHFAPQSGNRASQRTQMLREIRFLFEHRIFASATPHNGKTVCFTGLLELLDPIRFQMTVEMDPQDKDNLAEVRIRRLKDDINKQSLRPPFAEQLDPVALPIQLSPQETALYAALREYRKKGHAALSAASAAERWLGQFIYSLLTKRLLSCPLAFARTWWRHLDHETPDDQGHLFDMARVSAERAEEQTRSDEEKSVLEEDAAHYSGAWFRSQGHAVENVQAKVKQALEKLGYDRKTVEDEDKLAALGKKSDSKTEALFRWVKQHLFVGGKLRDDERLIVFTEYKETLFYLEQRFLHEGFDKNTLRLLYGGMSADEFEAVKGEFEDTSAPARLLLATDAASEGINMQEECRWVIHYDVPWSPSRLVQRNGRVSRYGQDRDVSIYYFRCDQEEDMKFLSYVAGKVCQVQNDLGSVERVFDAAIQRHFQGKPTDAKQLSLLVDQEIARSPERVELGHAAPKDILDLTKRAKELLESTDTRLGVSPQSLAEILRAAIAVEGQGALEDITGKPGFYRLKPPPRWEGLARQTLTVGSRTDRMELVFDTALVEEEISGRRVLRLKKHQVLLRLGHPIMRQAMATLCRQLHAPDPRDGIFRWSLAALQRSGFEALLVFHYTVTAVNELREPLHDEVYSTVLRIEGDRLARVEDAFQRTVLGSEFHPIQSSKRQEEWVRTFRGKWFQHRSELEAFLRGQEKSLHGLLQGRADATLQRESAAAKESYRYRLRELEDRSREQELNKLAKALLREQAEAMQPTLFGEIQEEAKFRAQEIEEQMSLLRRDVERTRDLLKRERDKRLNVVLPKRFQLREVRALPLALVYLVPATAEHMRR